MTDQDAIKLLSYIITQNNILILLNLVLIIVIVYCSFMFRTMIDLLTKMSVSMRILETVDHRLNIIEIKLERLSK